MRHNFDARICCDDGELTVEVFVFELVSPRCASCGSVTDWLAEEIGNWDLDDCAAKFNLVASDGDYEVVFEGKIIETPNCNDHDEPVTTNIEVIGFLSYQEPSEE
jgi:hypothetical protein